MIDSLKENFKLGDEGKIKVLFTHTLNQKAEAFTKTLPNSIWKIR